MMARLYRGIIIMPLITVIIVVISTINKPVSHLRVGQVLDRKSQAVADHSWENRRTRAGDDCDPQRAHLITAIYAKACQQRLMLKGWLGRH